MIFGQLGDDTIQGDGSIEARAAGASRVPAVWRRGSRSGDLVVDRPASRPSSDGDRLHRGRRRQRRDLRRPRPGRHHRRQLRPVLARRTGAAPRRRRLIFGGRRRRIDAIDRRGDLTTARSPRPRRRHDRGRQRRHLPARRHGHRRPSGDGVPLASTTTAATPSATRPARRAAARLHAGRSRLRPGAVPGHHASGCGADVSGADRRAVDVGGADEIHGEAGDDIVYAAAATTSSSATARTTTSSAAGATTGSPAAPATTASSATTAASSRAATALAEPLYGIAAIADGSLDLDHLHPGQDPAGHDQRRPGSSRRPST